MNSFFSLRFLSLNHSRSALTWRSRTERHQRHEAMAGAYRRRISQLDSLLPSPLGRLDVVATETAVWCTKDRNEYNNSLVVPLVTPALKPLITTLPGPAEIPLLDAPVLQYQPHGVCFPRPSNRILQCRLGNLGFPISPHGPALRI